MAWKASVLCYTTKKNGKTCVRSYAGVSASPELVAGCAYIGRSEECVCMGHLHAETGGTLERLPMNDEDQTYLKTVQKHWARIVEAETGVTSKDWSGSGWARSDATSAYAYIIPLPNDCLDDPTKMRDRIETLLKTMYVGDTMDLSYALHSGEKGDHDKNLHLHIYVRPRRTDGKKWRMGKGELLKWNEEKRLMLERVLQSWGYETEFVPTGKGQKRMTRGEHAIFLRKGDAVASEPVRIAGTALKKKNEGNRNSRWHAGLALRYSAYRAVVKNCSWADALREQGWELCRAEGDRRTWQICDVESGKTFALRRLFSCKEQEVENYLQEMKGAIEQAQIEIARIKQERPEAFAHAHRSGPTPTLGSILGDTLGKSVRQEPGGAIALLLLCPALIVLVAALLVAVKGLEENAVSDEKALKSTLSASWKEEKELRTQVRERLSSFVQQKNRPLPPSIGSTPIQSPTASARPSARQEKPRIFGAGQQSLEQAIRTGDLKTAGKIDKDHDGIADILEQPSIIDADGNGIDDNVDYYKRLEKFHVKQETAHVKTIVEQWHDMKKQALADGKKKDSGILNYDVTKKMLKKYGIDEIKTAFKASSNPIPSGVLRCLADAKQAREDEYEAETMR